METTHLLAHGFDLHRLHNIHRMAVMVMIMVPMELVMVVIVMVATVLVVLVIVVLVMVVLVLVLVISIMAMVMEVEDYHVETTQLSADGLDLPTHNEKTGTFSFSPANI